MPDALIPPMADRAFHPPAEARGAEVATAGRAVSSSARSPIIFCWENFGPTHVDRCDAVAARFPGRDIIGIEFSARSAVYAWDPQTGRHFRKITLLRAGAAAGWARIAWSVLMIALKSGSRHIFLCHYEEPGVEIASLLLRMLGRRVYMLIDSKFDDYPRSLWREVLKSLWIMHYSGAVVGSMRTRQYLTFLGLSPQRIVGSYCSLSVARLRALAGAPPAPAGVPFAERHFTAIARLVPKKNLFALIDGFALYAQRVPDPRLLKIFGNGELEVQLREHAAWRGVEPLVVFEGFRQTAEVCRALARSLALVLISTEEQFGFAVIEALALGVPVIVSETCGARDDFVRSGVNGFLVEPDNPEGLAFHLQQLSEDEALWNDLARKTAPFAEKADVSRFAEAIASLIETRP